MITEATINRLRFCYKAKQASMDDFELHSWCHKVGAGQLGFMSTTSAQNYSQQRIGITVYKRRIGSTALIVIPTASRVHIMMECDG